MNLRIWSKSIICITPGSGQSKDDVTSSIVPDSDSKYYQKVEERGYQGQKAIDTNGRANDGPVDVDGMIDGAREVNRDAELDSNAADETDIEVVIDAVGLVDMG